MDKKPNYTARRIIALLIAVGIVALITYWATTPAPNCIRIVADFCEVAK